MNILTRNVPRQYLRNGNLNLTGEGYSSFSYGLSGMTGGYLPALPLEEGGYLVEDPVTFMQKILIQGDTKIEGNTQIDGNLNVYGDSNLKDTNIDGDINLTGKIYVNGEEFNGGGESYLKDLKDINYNWENVYQGGYLRYNGNKWSYQSLEEHKQETGITSIISSLNDIRDKLSTIEYQHFDIDTNNLSGNGNPWDDYQDFIRIKLTFETRTNLFRIIRAFRLDIEITDDWGTSYIKFNALPDWGGDGTDTYASKYSVLGLGPHRTFYFASQTNNHYVVGHNNYVLIPICSEWYHTAKHVMVKARCNEIKWEPTDGGGTVKNGNYVSDISVVSGSINEYGYFTSASGEFDDVYKYYGYNTTAEIEKFVANGFNKYGVDTSNSDDSNFALKGSFSATSAAIANDINLGGDISLNPAKSGLYWKGQNAYTYVSIVNDDTGLTLYTDSHTYGDGDINIKTEQAKDNIILTARNNVFKVGCDSVTINDKKVLIETDLDHIKIDNYYTKSESDNKYYAKEIVYTKNEVDTLIDNIDVTDTVYTKDEVYNKQETEQIVSVVVDEKYNYYFTPLIERLNTVEGQLGDIELLLDSILGYETNEYLNETLDEIIG